MTPTPQEIANEYAGKLPPDHAYQYRERCAALILAAAAKTVSQSGAEADKARIDWLDANCPNYSVGRTMNAPDSPDPMPFAFKYGLGSRAKTIPFRGSVRHAIDAAMEGNQKAKDPFHPLYDEAAAEGAKVKRCEHGQPKDYICPQCAAALHSLRSITGEAGE